MLEVGNITSTTVTANSAIPFSIVYFNTNSRTAFDNMNNALVIKKQGIYKSGGSFVIIPSASGIMNIKMFVNGNAQPTAVSSMTVTSGETYTFTIPSKYLNIIPTTSDNTVSITFVTDTNCSVVSSNAFVYFNEQV